MPDREKVIECLQKAKMVIETWVPMFEQYNTPAGIDDAIAMLKEQEVKRMVRTVEFIQKSTYVEIPDENGEMQVYAIPETIEGVQELVRCKNCKHGEPGACGYGIDCDGFWHEDDWFCADGEREPD